MCGILGTVNHPISDIQLSLIKHRGPDDQGIVEQKVGNHKVYLGHTRLAIVDLSPAGHQPMISHCGNYAIVFNGEIYNHHELRKKVSGIEFRGHSDTETILYYLIQHGIDAVREFNGIFVFAFLDMQQGKIYIVRDHFGVKPLYYCQNGNYFIFSSEIRPISSIVDLQYKKDNLATLLRLRYLPSPLTLYKEVKKVRPAHFLKIELSTKKIQVIEKSFVQALPKTVSLPKDRAVADYGMHLEAAVKRQLMSDVEVGILLSGGVDSALVAHIAQNYSERPLKAFTIGFEGEYSEDEIAEAQKTAEWIGLEHIVKRITFSDFLRTFKEVTRIVEEPLATTSVIPMYFLAQLASKHVKVVLTGQGADEPLGGYKRYQGELISQNIPRFCFKVGDALIKKCGIKSESVIRAFHSLGEHDDIKRFLRVYSLFDQEEIKALLNIDEYQAVELVVDLYNKLKCKLKTFPVERMMALDTRMNLSDDLLLYTDKITMHFALEARVPMLDIDLIKFIESLPVYLRVKWGAGKIIHKAYAEEVLPSYIVNRKKKGFQSPTRIWFRKYINEIKELLLSPGVFTDIFNPERVEKILSEHLQGFNREKQIFLMLGIYFWIQKMNN